MSQTRFLQQLRSRLYTGTDAKTIAIAAVKSQMSTANDGSFVLGRYQDGDNNIRTIIGANYSNGGTNSMSIYDFDKIASDALLNRVSTVETTLGISSDGTVTGETIVGRIEDVEDLLETLNGEVTVEGSIKKQIKDAVDAEAAIARAAEQANANAIVAEKNRAEGVEQTLQQNIDNEISARTAADSQIRTDFAAADSALQAAINAEVQERKDADSALENKLMGEVSENDAKTIAALNDKIESVESAAKSYSIVVVDGEELEALGTNVKEAYKLVDEDNAKTGEYIKIYKDSSLKTVALDGQSLNFTYILADGSESTVGVDVSSFLAESEFTSGLQVIDHVVSVKIADDSEEFLTVSTNGIKLSGVQNAINTLDTDLQNQIDGINTTITTLDAEYKAADTALQGKIDTEKSERTAADSGLDTRIKVLEEAVGGDSVETQITEAIDDLKGTPEGKTLNESYDTIYEIAEELAKLEGDENKEGSIAYDIKAKVDSLDSTKTGEGTFVDVTVTQVDGVITEVSVVESDIASAKDLSDEIDRAKAAEKVNSDNIAAEVQARKDADSALVGNASEDYNTLGKLETAIKAVDSKVEAFDVDDSEVLGSYVTEVDQTNGVISTSKKSLVSSANENDMLVADTTNGGLTLSTVWDCGTFEYETPNVG